MIQLITDGKGEKPVADQIRDYINAGGRWVTIDLPEASDAEVTDIVEQIKPLCLETETFLLLTSRIELAKKLDVGGVFLKSEDLLPSKARMLLGPAAVIGVEAHDLDGVKAVRSLDVDYVALSPFRSEDGKGLGIEGIRKLHQEILALEIDINHVAAGGVRAEDVEALKATGINGIAMTFNDPASLTVLR